MHQTFKKINHPSVIVRQSMFPWFHWGWKRLKRSTWLHLFRWDQHSCG